MDNKNLVIAIVLSVVVLFGWQYFVAGPHLDAQRKAQEAARQLTAEQAAQGGSTAPAPQGQPAPATGAPPTPQAQGGTMPAAATPVGVVRDRAAVVGETRRVAIDTPALVGSVNLTGARLDDLKLKGYRETVDRTSAIITLLNPAGAKDAYYAEFGWVADPSQPVKLPSPTTVWSQAGSGALGVGAPVTLTWDNGEGLTFKRVIEVDAKYMFKISDSVENRTERQITLYPFALVARHGTPQVAGFFIQHEGLIGVFGDQGLKEVTYKDIKSAKVQSFDKLAGSYVGFVDKYWATAIVPEGAKVMQPRFSYAQQGTLDTYQTDVLGDATVVPAGGQGAFSKHFFAGAKEVQVIDGYQNTLGVARFDRLIDWGWFYFLTKPLFELIDFLYKFFGNFGIAILAVTLIIKIVFFWFANKSYESMAKMKKVQPAMMAIKERFADDKMKQQQAMMELYRQEKINPLAGCLPILIQIPVFFALYKVLFVTIEMRHAPFFGWIQDLSAPDPTSLFNLFGLLPYTPPAFLALGIWPLIMGVTMFIQMKMNPAPPDPTQKLIFDWMPVIFTFMLASFPAGLVIYWAWNNLLSILQQAVIMRKNGVPVDLWTNIRYAFRTQPPPAQ